MTYQWEITGLYKQNIDSFNDVITNIKFKLSQINESENISFEYNGNIRLDLTNLNEQSFLSLNQLNNTILLEWLETAVRNDVIYWNHINEQFDSHNRFRQTIIQNGNIINPL